MPANTSEILSSPAALGLRERLIVALDVPNAREAVGLVRRIGDAAGIYKIGLQLFVAEGPDIVRELVASGRRVFLDLKLHDIPNTVGHAVKAAVDLGANMLTVHAGGGSAMLKAAVDAASGRLTLLAVTVLTSMDEDGLHEVGVPSSVLDQALKMAALAQGAGCGGVVTSPREAAALRKFLGDGMAIVTPGVRPAGAESHDQKRIATPAEAIAAGASHIVVGRPIAHAADPTQAALGIIREMEQSLFKK
jgi:orotidine-5'-phosphate decarboxylase